MAAVLVGLAVLAAYLLPGLSHPGARWPLWDARVYWWGGPAGRPGRAAVRLRRAVQLHLSAVRGVAVPARRGPAPEGSLHGVITAGSIVALVALCWQALGAAGVRRRPETVFAVAALALLTWPVDYTLHLARSPGRGRRGRCRPGGPA